MLKFLFLVCDDCFFTVSSCEEDREEADVSSYEGTNPIVKAHPHDLI